MAAIVKPRLKIQNFDSVDLAKVTVTCRIFFNECEYHFMKHFCGCNVFRLSCSLYGMDAGPDELLYTFSPSKGFPDTSITQVEDVKFEKILKESVLDEDPFWHWLCIGNLDEIYGRLRLTNLFAGTSVVRNTNVVQQEFGDHWALHVLPSVAIKELTKASRTRVDA